jgi:hypothetical protein
MYSRTLRKVWLISFLISFTGCESGSGVLRLLGWDSQSKAIDRATEGSPNERIQFQAHEAHEQLNRPFF